MNPKTKLLIKNTGLLYLRMGVILVISLFTSREVLRILGIEDYGVYSVVAGVIGMFSFLNNALSGATSRFLIYELGTNNRERYKLTFSTSVIIHILLAIIVIILGETIGLWFVIYKINIPENTRTAALILYQLSIISAAVTITQVPYNAILVAREKFNLFAMVEMSNAFLKLLIIYLLIVVPGNKLITYGTLTFLVSFSIAMFYRILVHKIEPKLSIKINWHKETLKPMLSYTSWELYGHLSSMIRTTGIVMVLNLFFGPIINAANNLATTIQNTVMAFGNDVTSSMKPQIIKSYANNEYTRTTQLLFNGAQVTFFILTILSIPIILNVDYILNLWLTEVPSYTADFTVLVLIYNLFATFSIFMANGCNATGKIKRQNFLNGTIYMLVLPTTYMAFKYGISPIFPYIFNIVAIIIGGCVNAYTCFQNIPYFKFSQYLYSVFFKCTILFVASLFSTFFIGKVIGLTDLLKVVVETLLNLVIVASFAWLFVFDDEIKMTVISVVKSKLLRCANN